MAQQKSPPGSAQKPVYSAGNTFLLRCRNTVNFEHNEELVKNGRFWMGTNQLSFGTTWHCHLECKEKEVSALHGAAAAFTEQRIDFPIPFITFRGIKDGIRFELKEPI